MSAIESCIEKYKSLNLQNVVNYDKFNEFAITAHSTQIEGSKLTVEEASLLIDEGITPKGKPLEHSLMAKDYHEALKLAIRLGKGKTSISTSTICQLDSWSLKSTLLSTRCRWKCAKPPEKSDPKFVITSSLK